MAQKKKAFGGAAPTETKNTAATAPTPPESRWTSAIKESVSQHEGIESINAKMVPIGQLRLDDNNPRALYWTPTAIAGLLASHPFTAALLQDDDQIEAYLIALPTPHTTNDKAAQELRSLLRFAGSLGSADRIVNPITGYLEGMTITIIAGERRFLACLLLGASHAPVRLLKEKPGTYDLVLLQWSENQDREDLSLFEQIGNLRRIMAAWKHESGHDLSVRELAVRTSLGKSQAAVYVKVIRDAKKSLLARIETGEITSIKEAARLTSAPPSPKPPRKTLATGSIRVAKDTPLPAARFVVEAAIEKLGNSALTRDIHTLDLKQITGINQALKLIVKAITDDQ